MPHAPRHQVCGPCFKFNYLVATHSLENEIDGSGQQIHELFALGVPLPRR